jgi:outer membrane protein assembly factor BamB
MVLGLTVFVSAGQAVAEVVTPNSQANWSQYHYSVDHRGVNPLETILSPSTVSGLHEVWSSVTGGPIYSSPAVVDGVVYVGSYDDHLYAFDAATGTTLWSTSLYAPIVSSPAVLNGVVYVGSGEGLFALDASTGAILWEQTLGTVGVSAPPTVYRGVVYVSGFTVAYALDAATGAILWSVAGVGSQVSAITLYRGRVFVAGKKVYALDPATGALLWSKSVLPESFQVSAPAAVNGLLYVGSSASATAFAFRAATGKVAWRTTVGAGILDSSPAVFGGRVYLSNYSTNTIWALDARTGSVVWSASGGGSQSAPAFANGVIYCGSRDGNLYAFDAGTGAVLWAGVLGAAVDAASPAVANGMVYIGASDGTFHAFGL